MPVNAPSRKTSALCLTRTLIIRRAKLAKTALVVSVSPHFSSCVRDREIPLNLQESDRENCHNGPLPPRRKLQPQHHRNRQDQDVNINGCIDATRNNREGLGPDTDSTSETRSIDTSHFRYNFENGECKTAKGCEGDAKPDEDAHCVADFEEPVKEKEDGAFDKEDDQHVGQAKSIEYLKNGQ